MPAARSTSCCHFNSGQNTTSKEYLLWNGLHPTAAAHEELAEFAANVVDNEDDEDDD
jgi:phospholipase/lecithinase/hemolysin